MGFNKNYIYLYKLFFSKNKLFKLTISLEPKYNKLQFVLESAPLRQANKSYMSLHRAMSTTILQKEIHPGAISFSRAKGFTMFSNKHFDVSAVFPSRRVSRNSSKGLEEMLLDRVATESAIVIFFPFGMRDRK